MASLDSMVVGRVIGDVLDMFVPAAELVVQYGPKQVGNGCEIKPSLAADRPEVRIAGSQGRSALFTLIMVDPDAPSPSEPKMREWLHWLVVNIPDGGTAIQGKELVAYMRPQPPTGIHRYIFAVFEQEGPIGNPEWNGVPRSNFSTRNFAKGNGLGLPVAAVYFNAQKEPAGNKKR